MPLHRYANVLAWVGSLVGLAYGLWAWGTLLLFGLDPLRKFGPEIWSGVTRMPLYLPTFLGLYMLNKDLSRGDRWVAGALGGYAVIVGALMLFGERSHSAKPLDGTLVGFALPVCTALTALLAWRIHRSRSVRREQ